MDTETNVEKSAGKRTRKSAKSSNSSNAKATYTVRDIDMNQYITVKSAYPGRLVYKSARTGELFIWEDSYSEQDIELKELRNMRNTAKKFFENNWVVFDEEYEWVIDFLGLKTFYNNVINTEGVDALLKKSASEISDGVRSMTKGQKRIVAYRAMEMIRSKEIDSISVIELLEKELGINLIER